MGKSRNTQISSAYSRMMQLLDNYSELTDGGRTLLSRMTICVSCLFVIVTALIGAASATDYYVATRGNNSDPGNFMHPWQNVSYAAQQAVAGDTIYLFNGTWYDEHVVFANSGTATQQITVKAYNGTWTLDGVDWTGTAISVVGRSNILISDFNITNYDKGVSGRKGHSQNLTLSGFNIEDISGIGVDFDGASLSDSLITDFTIQNTSDLAISHLDYKSTDTYNVTISYFVIRDTSGEAINWRNSDRVYIQHGEIYDVGRDAIHLQLSMNNSVVDDVWVNNTGFHGICIHDHTDGEYPCYNNTIKNCYVGYATHNNIDLHGAIYDTTVENCVITGEHAVGQGIYYHNGGTGLIVRNTTISNVTEGIESHRPNVTIVNNTIVNIGRYGIYITGSNTTICDNDVISTGDYRIFSVAPNTIVERNNIHAGACRLRGCYYSKVADMRGSAYSIRSGQAGNTTIEYLDGKVYTHHVAYSSAPHNISSTQWHPSGSYTLINTSVGGYVAIDVTTYNITLHPTHGHLYDVTIDAWDEASGTYRITASSTEPDNPTWINFTTKDPSATYDLKKDDELYDIQAATDAEGVLRYRYTGQWDGSHTFEVSEGASDATPHITNLRNDAPTQQTVTLHWGCSVSNIDHYTIYKNGVLLDTTESPYYGVTNLLPDTSYTFSISATTTGGIAIETATLSVQTAAEDFACNIVRIANDVTASRGNGVTVPIRIHNATGVACTGIKLTYDPSVVTVTDVTGGDFTTHLKFDDMHAAAGWVVINTYIEGTQLTGDLEVADVTLVAVGEAGATSPLNMEILSMADQNGYSVPRTVSNGLFTAVSDTSPPYIIDLSASQLIPDDTDGVPSWGETATLSVIATDESDITRVTINLSAIGGLPVQSMTHMEGNVWSVTTSASAGTPPQTYELPVCATDSHGYPNMSESVKLVVMQNGDVTGEGGVRPDDVTLLENYVTYSSRYTVSSEFVADVTGDSVVDIADAMLLANCVAYPDQYTLR